ncbi:hypothetical protein KM043_000652 [Ampulex compressa]|nr:hypothetical protein KM043_000652 [Ampulex compressa]
MEVTTTRAGSGSSWQLVLIKVISSAMPSGIRDDSQMQVYNVFGHLTWPLCERNIDEKSVACIEVATTRARSGTSWQLVLIKVISSAMPVGIRDDSQMQVYNVFGHLTWLAVRS